MDRLRIEIEVGWKVRIIDHDHASEGRDDVTVTEVTADGATLTPKRPWTSQGRRLETMRFRWNTGDRVIQGRTMWFYYTPAPHTGKPRRLVKTFIFEPPRG